MLILALPALGFNIFAAGNHKWYTKIMRLMRANHGFALPTIVISSVVLFAVLAAATGMASSSTSALTQQYYESLANDAAESGSVHVEACLAANNNTPTWTAANKLTPATKCDGTASSGASLYLINKPTYQTTYTVEPAVTTSTGSITIKVTGKTELKRPSNNQVWKTYSKVTVMRKAVNASWSPKFEEAVKSVASDGAASDYFGYSNIAVSGDTAVVGAYLDDDSGSASGSAYVFVKSGSDWVLQTKLTASDGTMEDYFGISVAIDGDTIVVGANGDSDINPRGGSAYVFTRSGTTWTQQAKLLASDGAAYGHFGGAVSVSGGKLAIGATSSGSVTGIGSVYVFAWTGAAWMQQAKLLASDGAAYDYFGVNVAIDGDTVVAGAYFDDDKGTSSGSAYIFTRSGSTWTQQAKLLASDGAAGDYFGRGVGVSGNDVVIGAYGDDDKGSSSGSVYFFTRIDQSWF